jgi:CreA protein
LLVFGLVKDTSDDCALHCSNDRPGRKFDGRMLADRPTHPHLRGATEDTMIRAAAAASLAIACLAGAAAPARADDLPCVSTTFRFIGKNDRVCVSAFDDPKVPGVACHVSQARTGGLSGTIGLAEDPSRFSIACRQVGPINVDLASLTDREEVYSARTSIFFKRTHVYRVLDKRRNTLVYLAISDKLIEGSPQNAISTVPIMPWATGR